MNPCFGPLLLALLLTGCALPVLEPAEPDKAPGVEHRLATRLGQALAPQLAAHPGKSGIHPLTDPHAAFASRILLSRLAEHSLDVQYYIWRDDITGTLLLDALLVAAERGVQVRLLLDDHGSRGLDRELAALDSHPNIQVRLFNPFVVRSPRFIGFLTDFNRLNRRMHNKSFTADGLATLVGGRNVGDEYFGATSGALFADLDVLALGPVVDEVHQDFERYWHSASAYPVSLLIAPADERQVHLLEQRAMGVELTPAAATYLQAVQLSDFVRHLLQGSLPLEWVEAWLISDDPAKVLGHVEPQGLLINQILDRMQPPARQFDLISPYLVPGKEGTAAFAEMARQGVAVRILTNGYEATDVAIVHSGYARRRKAMLEAGILLHEMKQLPGSEAFKQQLNAFGSSGSSLHAKTFAVDGRQVFVGSFNFDPRSAYLNTEMGLVIESPLLAQGIHDAFATLVPLQAYQVLLSPDRQLYWIEQSDAGERQHETEPGTSLLSRAGVRFFTLLPLEWLL